MTLQQASHITTLESRARTREWQSWAESCELDMRSNYATTDKEVRETLDALERVRNRVDWFLSAVSAELKDLSMVSQPEPPFMLRERIMEALCEGLALSVDACHVVQDERE